MSVENAQLLQDAGEGCLGMYINIQLDILLVFSLYVFNWSMYLNVLMYIEM